MPVKTMNAALCRGYGPPEVVRIGEIARPEAGPGDILIRIRATTVSSADWRIRSLSMPRGFGVIGRLVFGLRGPRQPILGTELSGIVEAVGEGVTRFKPGDAVVAFPGISAGCHAEYRVMPAEGRVVLKPDALSFEEAAALSFGGSTALHYLRDAAKVQPGERVLVIGASGAVGSAGVQLAKAFGAEVTGVCSGGNIGLVRAAGADHVIDYTKTDYAAEGQAYDLVFDTVGLAPPADGLRALKPGGRLVLIVASLPDMLAGMIPPPGARKIISGPAKEMREHLETLAAMAQAGRFRPVIDQILPFARIAEAHARVATGRKRGSVVVTMPS